MYTNESQTAKLIKLGFEEPKNEVRSEGGIFTSNARKAYSIGELLSFLPKNIAKENEMPSTLNISLLNSEWCVEYADFLGADFEFCNTELIDALCDMVLRLKEKGVI